MMLIMFHYMINSFKKEVTKKKLPKAMHLSNIMLSISISDADNRNEKE